MKQWITRHRDLLVRLHKGIEWLGKQLYFCRNQIDSSSGTTIPAILAISSDPFIVYTSNAFAILGLRSLYFAVAGLMEYFVYLRFGLAAILAFVGLKMLFTDIYKVPTLAALGVIVLILATSVLASILKPKFLGDQVKP